MRCRACRLQDQLIIFMALAEGTSRVACGPPTLHTRTAMAVAEQLTAAKFSVMPPGAAGEPHIIECQGAGIPA
jgi:RNA 3'-terminal phosphate cyclase (ATP)